jgi:hypothetical protein
MTRYRRLRRADTKKQLDRETWATLDKLKFESVVRGAGEYLIEDPPIYFGQAFDAPPFFTFSSVAGNSSTHPEVKAIGWPTDQVDRTKDELLNTGWLVDGSFEHQMVWNDPVIPTVKDHNTYTEFQKIASDQGPGTGWKTPSRENWWVQGTAETSGSQPLWAISNERAYPNSNGYKSQYAARYIFDSSGETRWLIPISAWDANPWYGYAATDPDEWHLNDVWSWTSDVVMAGGWAGGYRTLAFNPPYDKWTINLKVYATEAVTYEAIMRQWDDNDNSYFGGTSLYQLLKEDTYTQEIIPNEWNEIQFDYKASEYWTTHPPTHTNLSNDWAFHTWMSRFTGGTAGGKVYVDDCYMWPNATTSGGLPMITIGVAEWVQDDGGAYIGAKLWIKVGGTEVTVSKGGV